MSIVHDFVTLQSGSDKQWGYLARPQGEGRWPGLVVIMEWWGIKAHMFDMGQRFAEAGFVALVPDLYRGKVAIVPEEAGTLRKALTNESVANDISAAARFLKRYPSCNGKAGAIGYCAGGEWVFLTAVSTKDLDTAVVYYGMHPEPLERLKDLPCPLLGIYGEEDTRITVPAKEQVQPKLKELGKTFEMYFYPGAPHAFFNDMRPQVYRPEASKDAWQKTLPFLKRYLA
ncbi:MAG: dienelactone hydrolase family protein [Chloroflexi bacterium]|nr:dienelactone hydrolase family protein [Chloroflexota bacterium]